MGTVTLGEILDRRERLAIGEGEAAGDHRREVRHVAIGSGAAGEVGRCGRRGGTVLILPGSVQAAFAEWDAALDCWGKDLAGLALAEAVRLPDPLIRFIRKNGIPAFASRYPAELLQSRLVGILRELAEGVVMAHGVLVDLEGCGLLLVGESGIGKTSYGLEIAARGHRWVADDAVVLQRRGEQLFGRPHHRTKNRIAIRERGILPAGDLLGSGALLAETRVTAVVRLERAGAVDGSPTADQEKPLYRVLGLSLPCERLVASADPRRRAAQTNELIRRWCPRAA